MEAGGDLTVEGVEEALKRPRCTDGAQELNSRVELAIMPASACGLGRMEKIGCAMPRVQCFGPFSVSNAFS